MPIIPNGQRAVREAFRRAGLWRDAEKIFETWPNLQGVTHRFAAFVTPYAANADGEPILDWALRRAMAAYRVEHENPRRAIAAYIDALAGTSSVLAKIRLSVRDGDGHWLIWRHNEPLSALLAAQGRDRVVQTSVRPRAEPAGPITIKLLAAICTTADMEIADIVAKIMAVDR